MQMSSSGIIIDRNNNINIISTLSNLLTLSERNPGNPGNVVCSLN